MLDRMPCRRDLEASATVETLSSTTRRRHRTRAEPEERVDLRHPKAPPEDPRYTSHDRTLSEPRDLYVTDVPRRRPEVCLSQSHRSGSESVHIGGAPAVGFGFL